MSSQVLGQIASTVAANIRAARKEKDMTQRQVAIALDVDARAITRWEKGIVRPSTTNLAALAQLFGRDPGWFYTDHTDERKAA